jgi:methylthioribose-1-phosphate isomerase
MGIDWPCSKTGGTMRTVEWHDGRVRIIDQRQIPWELAVLDFENYTDIARAIREEVVRGAQAIGVAAGFGLALAAQQFDATNRLELLRYLEEAAALLRSAHPGNEILNRSIDRVMATAGHASLQRVKDIRREMLRDVQRRADEIVSANHQMGELGAALIRDGDTVLHHGYTGALSTVEWGTALGVIRTAHEQGKQVRVLVDETRPSFDGARLSAWELKTLGIPFEIIPDGAAGHFMQQGQVNLVLVGAYRAVLNGDTANTTGTYALAVLARENGIPFYTVTPAAHIDVHLSGGKELPAVALNPEEVRAPFGISIVPADYPAQNPAFDMTPGRYTTGVITENGIVYPPYSINLRKATRGQLQPGLQSGPDEPPKPEKADQLPLLGDL